MIIIYNILLHLFRLCGHIFIRILLFSLSLYIFILDTVKLYQSIIYFETQAIEAGYVRKILFLCQPQHLNWSISLLSWNIHYGVVVRTLPTVGILSNYVLLGSSLTFWGLIIKMVTTTFCTTTLTYNILTTSYR